MKRSVLYVAAVAAFVAGCGDGGTDPQLSASGSVSFSYNGGSLAPAGSYSASGGMPLSEAEQTTRAWAAGVRDTENQNNIGVVASVPKANNRFDLVVLAFDRSTAGNSTIDLENCTEVDCAAMVAFYNVSESQNATGEVLCGLETGTMTLTSVSSTRATGTFSGTGSCSSFDSELTTVYTVTNGTFDVPLLSNVPGGGVGLMRRSR